MLRDSNRCNTFQPGLLTRKHSAWEQRKLGELISELSSGKSVNSEKGVVGPSDIGVLKTSCVSYDTFDPNECKRVVESEAGMVACPVEAETLIVSRMNTPDRVGACGFVPDDRPNLFLPDRLWKVRLTSEANPYLVFVLLVSDAYKARLKGMASGTSGSMHNIPKGSFRDLDIVLPKGFKEQRAIGTLFARLDSLITLHQRQAEPPGTHANMFSVHQHGRPRYPKGRPWKLA